MHICYVKQLNIKQFVMNRVSTGLKNILNRSRKYYIHKTMPLNVAFTAKKGIFSVSILFRNSNIQTNTPKSNKIK